VVKKSIDVQNGVFPALLKLEIRKGKTIITGKAEKLNEFVRYAARRFVLSHQK